MCHMVLVMYDICRHKHTICTIYSPLHQQYLALYMDPTEMRISPLIETHYAWSQLHREVSKTTPERRTFPLIRTLLDVVCGIEGYTYLYKPV